VIKLCQLTHLVLMFCYGFMTHLLPTLVPTQWTVLRQLPKAPSTVFLEIAYLNDMASFTVFIGGFQHFQQCFADIKTRFKYASILQ
ncbi:MAG: hypothetical protein Q4D38_12260, partial [Planctomycetia bacterium]|nr:hypothetical protein [Planctomycetia bacterium]